MDWDRLYANLLQAGMSEQKAKETVELAKTNPNLLGAALDSALQSWKESVERLQAVIRNDGRLTE